MRQRPKYQIFISSTYGDLREEREAVTWAVLSARHIPAGMENFTATDDRGWETITSVIDRSDYYVLIIAGRYGSVNTDGVSWTEKEYDYAHDLGIPILAFVRAKRCITADSMDDDAELRKNLENFKRKVTQRHLFREWQQQADLVAHVSNALHNQIQDDEDRGRGRPGWYRGDDLPRAEKLDADVQFSNTNANGIILSPSEGEKVPQRVTAQGKIGLVHPGAQAWLVVEAPNGVLYPQARVNLNRSTWKHEVYIGRVGAGLDHGREYRIDLVALGPDSAYQFEKYIRGESDSQDGLGRVRPADMSVLDSKRVVRHD